MGEAAPKFPPSSRVSSSGIGSSAESGKHLKDKAPAEATRGWGHLGHNLVGWVERREEGKRELQGILDGFIPDFVWERIWDRWPWVSVSFGSVLGTFVHQAPAEEHLGIQDTLFCIPKAGILGRIPDPSGFPDGTLRRETEGKLWNYPCPKLCSLLGAGKSICGSLAFTFQSLVVSEKG